MRRLLVILVTILALCAPVPAFAAAGASPAGTLDGSWVAPGSGAGVLTGMLIGGGGEPVASRPAPSAQPTAVNAAGKLIEIAVATQTMTMWENGRAVSRFLISTGRAGYRTPKGRFKVRAKGVRWWSRKWKVWMPYALNFYRNYNLHSLPHARGSSRLIGASQLGRPASHGCVRIGPANARRLYSWAPVGTPVWIH